MSKLSMFQLVPMLLLVVLYINAFHYTNSTLIDDFTEKGPWNKRDLVREISSAKIDKGLHLGKLGYLCESISTDHDPTDLHGKAFKMIYSTDQSRTCQLAAKLLTVNNARLQHELMFTVNEGTRKEIVISFKEFNCAHLFASKIAITADLITIHEIYIIDDINNNEMNSLQPENHPSIPSTFAPNVKTSTELIDDFRQWENPTNVLEGKRIISSIMNPQPQGLAILLYPKEYLIEYLPTVLANQYSFLRITYSTTAMNTNTVVKKRVGMVIRSDGPKIESHFFDCNLQKGNKFHVYVKTEFLIKLSHEFGIDGNIGIIIRGPLEIHLIELLSASSGETEIPFQIPASNIELLTNQPLSIDLLTKPVLIASNVKDSTPVLDDFRQWENPTNVLNGKRIIASMNPQHQGIAILSTAKEHLIEYLPSELAKNNYSLLRITYSTRARNLGKVIRNRVGIVRGSDEKELLAYFFDYNLQKGNRVALHISIQFLIKLSHEFQIGGNIGIIIRGPLHIHRIELLIVSTEETEIPFQIPASNGDIMKMFTYRPLFIDLPTIPMSIASNVKEDALVLDDFRQWESPENVLKGYRIFVPTNSLHLGIAILSSPKEFLIEYFPTEIANKNYSLLCITYSTTTLNKKKVVNNLVGMVQGSDEKELQSYFFDYNLQKGNRVELHISIQFLIKLSHEFRIDGNIGIIIRGPLKIHRIEFLTANSGETKIPFQIPASNDEFRKMMKSQPVIFNLPTVIPSTKVDESPCVLDDFRQWHNPTNVFKGNRVIVSMNSQNLGIAILSSPNDFLIEYFSTDKSYMNNSLLCISYSTTSKHLLQDLVGIVHRFDNQEIQSYFFDWRLQRGRMVKLNISIQFLIRLTHEFQIGSNIGIIIRGPLIIHRIEFLTANSGEPKIPFQIPASNDEFQKMVKNRPLIFNLPTIPAITSTYVNEPALVLDDFRQWCNPTNVLKGNRNIFSVNPQHRGHAILTSHIDNLIEYFPNGLANKNYSLIRITYSTSRLNWKNVVNILVGVVHRSDDQIIHSYSYDLLLQKGVKVKMRIPIKIFMDLCSEFQIDSNHGIIISGPLKIHLIELLTANIEESDITFENPGFYLFPTEMDNHACGLSSNEMDNHPALDALSSEFEYEAHDLSLFQHENQANDHFPSQNNLVDIWSHANIAPLDDRSYNFKIKYKQFLCNLTQLKSNEAYLLEVHYLNVLRGSFEKMDLNAFRMQLGVSIQFDVFNDVSHSTKYYFELLHNEILAVQNQLFEYAGHMLYRIIPKRYVDQGVLDYYRFVGRALGMGIMSKETQLTKFVPMVYKILLNKPILHSELGQSYPSLLVDIEQTVLFAISNPGFLAMYIPNTEPYVHLNFIVELIHKNKNFLFTVQNMDEYVSSLQQQYVQELIGTQSEALRNGLYDVIPEEKLAVFDEHELVHILMGCPTGHEYLPSLNRDCNLVEQMCLF